MNGREYVSFFPKKPPALVRERVVSSYFFLLSNKLISWIAIIASWVINIAQNCQLVILTSPNPPAPDWSSREETSIFPSVHQLGEYGQGH